MAAGFAQSRFAARDVDFVLRSPSMNAWAQTWFWRGNAARYLDLDPEAAAAHYAQAVRRDPLLLDAWFAMARMQAQSGRLSPGLVRFLLHDLPAGTVWQWPRLLLAADTDDARSFRASFNFVLAHLPKHRQEAMELAARFYGSWDGVLAAVDPENRWTALDLLLAQKETDAALRCFSFLEADPAPLDPHRTLRLVDYLIWNERLEEARSLWARHGTGWYGPGPVTNGGFEDPLLGRAFGWRLQRHRNVEVRRTGSEAREGEHSVHLHFLGTENLRYHHLWQLVSVEPGRSYQLQFARKARGITTDRGVYVEVTGFRCPGLRVKSEEVTGSSAWREETLAFTVPESCTVVRLGVRRDESLKFDNKIAGDYWIDAVRLVEAPSPGE
ncbi:MAG: hypothetical protein JG766_426 [Desulfacinum sp.]|jgi:hypothetical protein|nr:hypothetical protein [Desulfacinum sp.]